ncbi:MAG TPA: transporter substrate-binding domain-containing protein [Nitratidesulfovibrio sp.]|nr:transporter substrate-binding domain-containing protein [Nitratidesulfovibrio sp.]
MQLRASQHQHLPSSRHLAETLAHLHGTARVSLRALPDRLGPFRLFGQFARFSRFTLFMLCMLSALHTMPLLAYARENTQCPPANTGAGGYLLVNTEYPPYTVALAGDRMGGTATRLTEELFRRLALPVRQRLLPWNRALRMMQDGEADGVSILAHSDEREASMAFSAPVTEARQSFYYVRSNHEDFLWQQYEDLLPYRIGLVQGYTYSPEFLAAVERLHLSVEFAPSDESNFSKLRTGRVDLCLSNDLVAEAYLTTQPGLRDTIGKADRPVRIYPLHMAFSRRSPLAARLPEINAELERMRADGTLKRIFSQPTEAAN